MRGNPLPKCQECGSKTSDFRKSWGHSCCWSRDFTWELSIGDFFMALAFVQLNPYYTPSVSPPTHLTQPRGFALYPLSSLKFSMESPKRMLDLLGLKLQASNGSCKSNLSPLWEQPALLTTESSLQHTPHPTNHTPWGEKKRKENLEMACTAAEGPVNAVELMLGDDKVTSVSLI